MELLDYHILLKKYNMIPTGVVHIGGHYGQEHSFYRSIPTINHIMYFEPDPTIFNVLKKNINGDAICEMCALGSKNIDNVDFNVASNGGASSSILNPTYHKTLYPQIKFDSKIKVNIRKLDDFNETYNFKNIKINFMVIDVQGYELEVFKGSIKTLESIDYIDTEINKTHLYENCCLVEELDDFLKQFNFKRVETSATQSDLWGDALYIKENK